MAEQGAVKQPLGIGRVLGDSFSHFFSGFLLLMAIILIPTVILLVVQFFVTMSWITDLTAVSTSSSVDPFEGLISTFSVSLILFFLFSLVIGVVIWGAAIVGIHDKIRGRRMGFVSYFLIPLKKFPQIFVLSIVMFLAIGIPTAIVGSVPGALGGDVGAFIGVLLAIVVALYLMAAFNPLLPSILIDNAGWGSMSRALNLTRGYRWPIVGITLIFFIIMFIIALIFGLVFGALSFAVVTTSSGSPEAFGTIQIFLQILNAISTAAITGFSVTYTVVLFNRLVEIKEGPAAADLEQVFE